MTATTIQLDKSLVESLKSVREYPRQTYNELIEKGVHIGSFITFSSNAE